MEIRLRRRRSFRLSGEVIPLPPVRAVAMIVDDLEGFLAALRQHVEAR